MDSRPREVDSLSEAADGAAAKIEVEVTKPRNDKRGYRRVVLPNALECLLISDPDTDKAAASMNVSVGYFCDPDGLEGLAHFLEHMLFYASEKYPIEDSYSKYIAEHGGSTNAFTTSEHTNFYFDVNNDCLDDALDRFAQFFIKPLMSPDATLREIKAVDSENQKNLLSDPWRMSQLQKHLCSNNHPYHKFSTGNWNTLEVKPKEKGFDTRLELINFYDSHYSANLMQLVVYGKESLDNIQTLVESKFCDIKNVGRKQFSFPGHPCSSKDLQILVKAVPIKQGHTLRVLWPITPNIRHYKEGPCRYVSHLIGHEGEGSLFYILKKLGWAMSLESGEGDWSYEFSFFSVVIQLTDVGHEHMEDVIGLLFRYITLLQTSGTPKWIFDELLAICETGFNYRDKSPPMNYCANISSNMQIFPPEDWLIASSVPSKFSPDAIQRVLNELTPDNVRIFWESKLFEGQANLTEPWYGTSYCVEAVPPSTIQKWVEKAPNEDLHLPKPNIFIPTDLSLKKVEEKTSFPCMLRKTPFSRLWYKPDTLFFTPKVYIKMDFHCPLSHSSPESSVLTGVFTRLLMDYLNDYAYDAEVAGLYYAVVPNDTGFQVSYAIQVVEAIICSFIADPGATVTVRCCSNNMTLFIRLLVTMVGYNDKMTTLLDTVIGKIADFEVKVDRFSVIKDPFNLDARVEAFLEMFEVTLHQMPDAEFKSNVNALIDMKLEKYKNIREESAFFWGEISEGTLKFDRKEAEVAALRELKKEELIEFFDNHVKVGAREKKILSIQVYGCLHSSEYEKILHDAPPPHWHRITDIFSFRRSRPLYGSLKGGAGQMKL
ncbi:hypothetical protein ACQ4PT_021817 [Festuca glaucescens]